MIKIVRRLPIIEDFVAVLNWCKESSYNVGGREDIEGNNRFELEWGLWSLREWSRGDGHPLSWWWRGHCVEPGTGGQLHGLCDNACWLQSVHLKLDGTDQVPKGQ